MVHLIDHQHYELSVSEESMLLVYIQCNMLAVLVFLSAAGGGNADHAGIKWHLAKMQKKKLSCFTLKFAFSLLERGDLDGRGPNERS